MEEGKMAYQATKEQIKEFWEWCGFKYHGEDREFLIYASDGTVFNCGQPRVDLNNLFKYAVPKLFAYDLHTYWASCDTVTEYTRAEVFVNNKSYVTANKDPALALFWAIWEVIKGGA